MFGLLGPKGAGKSTLMRIIATLQEPDSGSVGLGDLDVLREKDRVRRLLGYLLGRFAGALAVAVAAFVPVVLGVMLGSLMPWLEPERVGPFRIGPYLQGLAVFVVPNTVFTGCVLFSLASVTRSLTATYASVVGMFVAYGVAGNLASDIENETLAAMLDPFGVHPRRRARGAAGALRAAVQAVRGPPATEDHGALRRRGHLSRTPGGRHPRPVQPPQQDRLAGGRAPRERQSAGDSAVDRRAGAPAGGRRRHARIPDLRTGRTAAPDAELARAPADTAHAVDRRRGGLRPPLLDVRVGLDRLRDRGLDQRRPDRAGPGYLQREWTEGGRRYFHYKMDAPILGLVAWLSADWEVATDRWNDVAIEVPYQHRQLRIVESATASRGRRRTASCWHWRSGGSTPPRPCSSSS